MKSYRYFRAREFECPCCGEEQMKDAFVHLLDEARNFAGIPFKINSGFRCDSHTETLKEKGYKVAQNSPHLRGWAADIHCVDSRSRAYILDALGFVGFSRIGIAKNFIHVDNDPCKDEQVVWVY